MQVRHNYNNNHNDVIKTTGRYKEQRYRGDLKTVQYQRLLNKIFDITGLKMGLEFERLINTLKGDKQQEITIYDLQALSKMDERKARAIIDTCILNPDKARAFIDNATGGSNE